MKNPRYISASAVEPRTPNDAVMICINQTQNTEDPVEILRTYQRVFLKGALLDQVSETEPLPDRDTLAIFVSRLELFATGLAELIDTPASDLMKPLEVTFYGEEASDSGGPRKEFFTIMMRSFMDIENRLFIKTDEGYRLNQTTSALEKRLYYGAALVCGLSLIENGPIPTFMNDDELTIIIEGQNLSEAQQQFREGFEILGILYLISEKPTFRYLFRSAHIPLTVKKLVSILSVQFSPEGSNRRRCEENIYKMFLKYLKEVAAGRRGKLQLGDILKFCTCSPEEPILGYTMKPMLVFVPEGKSALPTSSTCSNLIRLPVSSLSEKELFAAYDLAFCNDYFGIV